MSRLPFGVALVTLAFAWGCHDGVTVESGEVDVPSFGAAKSPLINPTGQRIFGKLVSIPLYNWDVGNAGTAMIGSAPLGRQIFPLKQPPTTPHSFMYLVAYPVGSTFPLQCYDVPQENCPDHGPLVAATVSQVVPWVYGNGVAGHDHLAPPHGKGTHVAEYPILVAFTSVSASSQHLTTRAEVEAAEGRGEVVFIPAPEFTFHNGMVNQRVFELGTPWVCPPYSFCEP